MIFRDFSTICSIKVESRFEIQSIRTFSTKFLFHNGPKVHANGGKSCTKFGQVRHWRTTMASFAYLKFINCNSIQSIRLAFNYHGIFKKNHRDSVKFPVAEQVHRASWKRHPKSRSTPVWGFNWIPLKVEPFTKVNFTNIETLLTRGPLLTAQSDFPVVHCNCHMSNYAELICIKNTSFA